MAEIKDSQLIRDALGSPVPQYWDEASQMYIARTVDGSFADVDFSKVRLIRDKLGSPIPQLWDTETARFVPGKGGGNGEVTIESVPGLRSELDQTNATLADTVGAGRKATMEDLGDDVISAVTGGATVNVLSIPQNGSVTPKKTTFLIAGKNLFNKNTVITGYYIVPATGALAAAAGYNTSDYIAVSPSTVYSRKQSNYIGYYDGNKAYISANGASGTTFTTPVNAAFIRISMSTAAIATEQVEVGSVSTNYEEFKNTLSSDVKLAPKSIGLTETESKLFEVYKGEGNLLDDSLRSDLFVNQLSKGTATLSLITSDEKTAGMGVSKTIRADYPTNMAVNSAVAITEFLPLSKIAAVGDTVSAGAFMKINKNPTAVNFSVLLAFYNSAKSWITGFTGYATSTDFSKVIASGVVPAGAVYVRLIVGNPTANTDVMQIDFYGMFVKKGLPDALLFESADERNFPNNPFKTKKVLFMGDSITQMANGWVSVFNSLLKPASYTNVAVSGAKWRDYPETPAYDGNPVNAGDNFNNVIGNQVQKILNNNYPAPDIIIIAAGTNDGAPESTSLEEQFTSGTAYIPLTSVDRKTFAGAMRYCVETLRNKYPNVQIFIATPIQAAEGSRSFASTKAKAERIKSVSERLSITVFDAFGESGIYGAFETVGANGKYLADGLHPNTGDTGSAVVGSESGATKLGKYFAKELVKEFAKS